MTPTTTKTAQHPAKFSPSVLTAVNWLLATYCGDLTRDIDIPGGTPRCLDPFAGTGGVLGLADAELFDWTLVELEPEWAMQCAQLAAALNYKCTTLAQNWLRVSRHPMMQGTYRLVVTSPTYGNRMADRHQPSERDRSKRITYRHKLGRPLTEGNSGGMQWGDTYREFHTQAWQGVWNVLAPGGWFVLDISDHIRRGERMPVTAWHKGVLHGLGFTVVGEQQVETHRMGFGANADLRVDHESVILWRKPT